MLRELRPDLFEIQRCYSRIGNDHDLCIRKGILSVITSMAAGSFTGAVLSGGRCCCRSSCCKIRCNPAAFFEERVEILPEHNVVTELPVPVHGETILKLLHVDSFLK